MSWAQLAAIGSTLLLFAGGVLVAVLEGSGAISGDWARTLWGFLMGSGVGAGGTVLVQRQAKPAA